MAVCGFSKVSLKDTFEAAWPFYTDLYCRILYIASGEEQMLVCAFDTADSWSSDTLRFRKAVSAACDIPEKSIIYHELQLHAAPGGTVIHPSMDKIIARVIPAVEEAKRSAKPFTCEVSEVYFGTECSYNREQYVEGLGGVTVWMGMEYDAAGKPCTQKSEIMLLHDYRPDLEILKKPLYFDNPVDPLAYLFVFRGLEGEVLGTVSRFAAHPDVAVLFEHCALEGKENMYRYDFDWCGYLSEKLEAAFGGTSVYLNGPCADLTAKKNSDGIDGFEACDRECRRLGELFAEKLLASFASNRRVLKNTDFLRTETFRISLPMRDDMPLSVEDANNDQERIEQARLAYENAKNDSSKTPAQVKRTVDDYHKAMLNGYMTCKMCGFDDDTLKKRVVDIDIPCVRFGEYLFVGVPGECLVETTLWLRSTFTGSKTIPVDQCNGYFGYMATPRSLTLGGYTYWCSWTTRDSMNSMQEQLVPCINKLLNEN